VSDKIIWIETCEVFTREEDDEMKVTWLNKTRSIPQDILT